MSRQPSPESRAMTHQPHFHFKVRPVPVAQMRVPPAYLTQRPFKPARGNYLAKNFDFDDLGFITINWRDGIYWIVDGQHRIWAMKAIGLIDDKSTVDCCRVYENLTDAESARIFRGLNNGLRVTPFVDFHLACTEGRRRECDIRRTVEAQSLKISQSPEKGCIGAVGALGKVYDRAGEVVLGQVIRTIRDGFNADHEAFDKLIIEGLGLVFNRYNGRTNEKAVAQRLAHTQYGARGLLLRAEDQRLRTGNLKVQCVAAAVVDLYNKGLNSGDSKRLKGWWKSANAA